ncbi:hypothetical protein CYMTET_50195 [Cymbomonas tetramitiformis]|uniref:Uncharacterized protein n=1 Tax=Cymbomonas tetramitiformis TaxID=36881 RepID=A0AAE0BPX1_9CHLO|nr:hypothetical protein CYMTET_50195 [Cymbomonas tetramitiformis]
MLTADAGKAEGQRGAEEACASLTVASDQETRATPHGDGGKKGTHILRDGECFMVSSRHLAMDDGHKWKDMNRLGDRAALVSGRRLKGGNVRVINLNSRHQPPEQLTVDTRLDAESDGNMTAWTGSRDFDGPAGWPHAEEKDWPDSQQAAIMVMRSRPPKPKQLTSPRFQRAAPESSQPKPQGVRRQTAAAPRKPGEELRLVGVASQSAMDTFQAVQAGRQLDQAGSGSKCELRARPKSTPPMSSAAAANSKRKALEGRTIKPVNVCFDMSRENLQMTRIAALGTTHPAGLSFRWTPKAQHFPMGFAKRQRPVTADAALPSAHNDLWGDGAIPPGGADVGGQVDTEGGAHNPDIPRLHVAGHEVAGSAPGDGAGASLTYQAAHQASFNEGNQLPGNFGMRTSEPEEGDARGSGSQDSAESPHEPASGGRCCEKWPCFPFENVVAECAWPPITARSTAVPDRAASCTWHHHRPLCTEERHDARDVVILGSSGDGGLTKCFRVLVDVPVLPAAREPVQRVPKKGAADRTFADALSRISVPRAGAPILRPQGLVYSMGQPIVKNGKQRLTKSQRSQSPVTARGMDRDKKASEVLRLNIPLGASTMGAGNTGATRSSPPPPTSSRWISNAGNSAQAAEPPLSPHGVGGDKGSRFNRSPNPSPTGQRQSYGVVMPGVISGIREIQDD